MKKFQTTYIGKHCQVTVNDEVDDHISVHEYGEPASSMIRHWETKKSIIKELREIIKELEELV